MSQLKTFFPETPGIAPDTSRTELHLVNEQKNTRVRRFLLFKRFTELSNVLFLNKSFTILPSITESSCPKTAVLAK